MTTLITVRRGGRVVGRCDERCYNATRPECDCCCGGRNHGVGRHRAEEETVARADEILADWRRGNLAGRLVFEPLEPHQGSLFDDDTRV